MEQLGSELRYVCTINEANMGLQLAAISKRFRLMAEQAAQNAASAGKSAEGTVQVGMNFQKMMENMKYAAMENAQVFGTPQPKIFVSERTPEGDLLVMRAHAAARDAIKALCPQIKVGLTLSLHDLQAQPGGEALSRPHGRRSSPIICLISKTMIFWVCRTIPAPFMARRGSCRHRRAQN